MASKTTLLPSRLLLSSSRCPLQSLTSTTASLSISSSSRRTFTTTPRLSHLHAKRKLNNFMSELPPYPHEVRHTFKQAWFGLYGGKHIQFGNNVPESNRARTRRNWHPNVLKKRIWSPALGVFLHMRVTASVLRTIDKCGGLDEYLLGSEKPARLKELGPFGWKLRWKLMQTDWARDKYAAQRKEFGLADSESVPAEGGGGGGVAEGGAEGGAEGEDSWFTIDKNKMPLTVEVIGDVKTASPFGENLKDTAVIRGKLMSHIVEDPDDTAVVNQVKPAAEKQRKTTTGRPKKFWYEFRRQNL